jgi:A/G-specific adenine glycosylase
VKEKYFASRLVEWYSLNMRSLPWRETNDPYFIWLSEILLQQTRVSQGLPYYQRFVKEFPDVYALAKANEHDVLRLWQGLGYYSRARNLHAAAKVIVDEWNGLLPDNSKDLLKLKGIGNYTAAAIASFAFDEKIAVLDGNVFRVLSRVFGVDTDIASNKGLQEFTLLANKLLPAKETNIYNQSIMEFGALHCTPQTPLCESCPVGDICIAKKHSMQGILPVKIKKLKKKTRFFNYLVLKDKNKIYLRERISKDIWKGLYEFHLLENSDIGTIERILTQDSFTKKLKKSVIEKESEIYKHVLTHQTIYAKFWLLDISSLNKYKADIKSYNLKSYNKKQIHSLPKSVLINNYLTQHIFS